MHDAIIISDLHIGAQNCQARLLVDFLEKIHTQEIKTKKLVLNGDIFENFNSRLHKWNWKILSTIRSISDTTKVIWIRGNHDAHGPAYSIAHLIGAEYKNYHVFESNGRRVLCIHGDIFDTFISDHPILTWLSDKIYWLLQAIDSSFYLAKLAKHSSKAYLRCAEKVRINSLKYKEKMKCDLVCCGHTHLAMEADPYYNSGTWTELPPTYLIVDNGKIELKKWDTL